MAMGTQERRGTRPEKAPEAGTAAVPPGVRPAHIRLRRPRGSAGRWLSIFAGSLGLFLVRFLVPVPVGQADNRDGPRLMCGLGVGPVTRGFPRYYRFAYFEYVPKVACDGRVPYPSSELVPLVITRVLTPLLALSGALNLVALVPAPILVARDVLADAETRLAGVSPEAIALRHALEHEQMAVWQGPRGR